MGHHDKKCECCECKKHHHHHGHHKHHHHDHHEHRGHHGPTGATGPTGPCCTGPTGPKGESTNVSLFQKIGQETCTNSTQYQATPLCICFTISKDGSVNVLVSLSAFLTPAGQDAAGEVDYQVVVDGTPYPGGNAASNANGFAGNPIILKIPLLAGQHEICVLWKVAKEGQSVCINPDDQAHGSLLITSSDGITPCS